MPIEAERKRYEKKYKHNNRQSMDHADDNVKRGK